MPEVPCRTVAHRSWPFHLQLAKPRPGDLENEDKSHPLYESTAPPSRRHLASFAASIAAHAAIVGLILCFAAPRARVHSEWVLAYLVEGTDGVSGRGGASATAPGAAAMRAAGAPPAAMPLAAAHKPRRRLATADAAVASLAPVHAVAQARPPAPAHNAPAASHSDAAGSDARAAVSGNGGSGAGTGAGPSAAPGGDGAGDSDSTAHADYGSDPPPVYPAVARRREEQGTVTVRVLIGADGSVERAEIADSSGFDSLDDAALDTVRSRWRFVPARHGGVAVESWVLVPIRFALIEADAVR